MSEKSDDCNFTFATRFSSLARACSPLRVICSTVVLTTMQGLRSEVPHCTRLSARDGDPQPMPSKTWPAMPRSSGDLPDQNGVSGLGGLAQKPDVLRPPGSRL